ncbi:MAG TPA: substrate-binding domain-containing protein, partial [Roseiflexaceae bacterium]|nr:substrate-binding domain-containing protein [Roseiflexaceae bacterium]
MDANIRTVGYITPAIFTSYFRLLLAGVQRAAHERNARLVIFQMTNSDVMRSLPYWHGIDGWVTCFSSSHTEQFYDPERPTVKICEPHGGAPAVLIDNFGGMRAVVEHLLQLGRTRIAFVGFPSNPDHADRLAGYQAALEGHAIAIDPELIIPASNLHFQAGAEFGTWFAGQYRRLGCDACAFTTDNLALGALHALTQAGVRVPDDLAVAGFDDMPEAQTANPPLTTVRIRFDAMSRLAVEHLLDILDGAPPAGEPLVMPTQLIPRRSAGEHSEPSDTAPALATNPGEALARQLAETVAAPQTLGPGEAPERLWPEVGTITGALDAIETGQPGPGDTEFQYAWASALRNVSYADPLEQALELIETYIAQLVAAHPNDPALQRRARAAARSIRTALLRVSVGGQVERINRSEYALSLSDRAARVLADSSLEQVCSLEWLATTTVAAAALGIWYGEGAGRQLQRAGAYPGGARATWQPIEEFPPRDVIEHAQTAPVVIMPLRSARRDWGLFALILPEDLNSALFDSSPLLAALLTARIDSGMAQREREAQQEELRVAYERARALSDT